MHYFNRNVPSLQFCVVWKNTISFIYNFVWFQFFLDVWNNWKIQVWGILSATWSCKDSLARVFHDFIGKRSKQIILSILFQKSFSYAFYNISLVINIVFICFKTLLNINFFLLAFTFEKLLANIILRFEINLPALILFFRS